MVCRHSRQRKREIRTTVPEPQTHVVIVTTLVPNSSIVSSYIHCGDLGVEDPRTALTTPKSLRRNFLASVCPVSPEIQAVHEGGGHGVKWHIASGRG